MPISSDCHSGGQHSPFKKSALPPLQRKRLEKIHVRLLSLQLYQPTTKTRKRATEPRPTMNSTRCFLANGKMLASGMEQPLTIMSFLVSNSDHDQRHKDGSNRNDYCRT